MADRDRERVIRAEIELRISPGGPVAVVRHVGPAGEVEDTQLVYPDPPEASE